MVFRTVFGFGVKSRAPWDALGEALPFCLEEMGEAGVFSWTVWSRPQCSLGLEVLPEVFACRSVSAVVAVEG